MRLEETRQCRMEQDADQGPQVERRSAICQLLMLSLDAVCGGGAVTAEGRECTRCSSSLRLHWAIASCILSRPNDGGQNACRSVCFALTNRMQLMTIT